MASSNNIKTVAQAARCGDLDEVKRLISEDHPVDVADNRGWRPIHDAADGNYLRCLEYLLDQEATDVNWQSFEGTTALHLACDASHVECVRLLLENRANPNIHDVMDTYPILSAVKSQSLDILQLLVAYNARVNVQLYCGTSPLHQAAAEGFTEIVKFLLEHNADLNIKEDCGITPLFSAAQYGQFECAKLLLERIKELGSSELVNSPADDGATPLYLASQDGHSDVVELLLENGASANMTTQSPKALPLHAALQFNRVRCVQLLLPHTDKRIIDKCDASPYYFSMHFKDALCTKELIDSGVSPSQRHPMDEICDFKPRSLQYFNNKVKHSKRMSPLVIAALCRCPIENAQVLLDCGASVDARTMYEVPPLLAALETKNYQLARMLIHHGSSLNIYHPKIISNMTLLLSYFDWKGLNLMLQCGAEPESLFSDKHVNVQDIFPARQRQEELEDCMSDQYDEDYENEIGILRFPIPLWRYLSEARMLCRNATVAQVLYRVLQFVGNVHLDPHLQCYLDHKDDWATLCSIQDSPRNLTHLCRLSIRHQMSPQQLLYPDCIQSLPLPEPVTNFLLYNELDCLYV